MRKVERLHPSEVPGRCMFFPQLIADPDGFYIGMDLDGLTPGRMRACISVRGVREIARGEGMVDKADLDAALGESESLRARVAELEAELSEHEVVLGAIDALESKEFRARKRPGRPKQKAKREEEVAA